MKTRLQLVEPRASAPAHGLTAGEEPLLTAKEAMAYMKLPSLGALYALNCRREIRFFKVGRRVRYRREDLDAYLMRMAVEPIAS